MVTGVAPGSATIKATAESVTAYGHGSSRARCSPQVVAQARIHRGSHRRRGSFHRDPTLAVAHPAVRWSISGSGAAVYPDGAFVAEKAGTYVVTASSGQHSGQRIGRGSPAQRRARGRSRRARSHARPANVRRMDHRPSRLSRHHRRSKFSSTTSPIPPTPSYSTRSKSTRASSTTSAPLPTKKSASSPAKALPIARTESSSSTPATLRI